MERTYKTTRLIDKFEQRKSDLEDEMMTTPEPSKLATLEGRLLEVRQIIAWLYQNKEV